MTNRQNPHDPSTLSLSPGSGGAADFSNVQGRSDTAARPAGAARADFSNVRSHVDTVPDTGAGAGAQSYTVKAGDTLSEIAQRHYGQARRWQAIFEANRDQLDDPDMIRPGQVLRLPPA